MSGTNDTNSPDPGPGAGLAGKLRFAIWGIRYFDIIVLMAYPTMGAAFAIDRIDLGVVVKFAVFTVFNFLFVAHVYIFNDWSDALLNPEEPKRRPRHALKHPVLTRGQVLACCMVVGAVAMVGFAFLSLRLLAVAVFIEIVTAAYSHPRINLKGRPIISTLIHFVGASLYFMGGWAVFRPFSLEELSLGAFFGLVLAAGHFSNEIEDFDQDLAADIRTNAIAFGQRKVFRAGLALFIISSGFFVFVSAGMLWFPLYLATAVVLLVAWLIQAWRYRDWKGGEPIAGFRKFYRAAYALLCAVLLCLRVLEWITEPAYVPHVDLLQKY